MLGMALLQNQAGMPEVETHRREHVERDCIEPGTGARRKLPSPGVPGGE